MERDLLESAVRELCMRYRSAAGRIQERAREVMAVAGMTKEHADETAAQDVLCEFAAAFSVDPYVYAVRLGVRDHVEAERLIAEHRQEMAAEMPVEPEPVPEPTTPFDILPLYEIPPRDTSYDEPARPPMVRARALPGESLVERTEGLRRET